MSLEVREALGNYVVPQFPFEKLKLRIGIHSGKTTMLYKLINLTGILIGLILKSRSSVIFLISCAKDNDNKVHTVRLINYIFLSFLNFL